MVTGLFMVLPSKLKISLMALSFTSPCPLWCFC